MFGGSFLSYNLFISRIASGHMRQSHIVSIDDKHFEAL